MDDVRAVMDAVGSERAVVFGVSEGGPMAMLFAATYPERTVALILYGTGADYTGRARLSVGHSTRRIEYLDVHRRATGGRWNTHGRRSGVGRAATPTTSGWRHGSLVPARAASPGAAISLSRMNREINVQPCAAGDPRPDARARQDGDVEFPIERDAVGSPTRSPARGWWSSPATTHFFWVDEYDRCCEEIERFVASSAARRPSWNGSSRRCCSPTSSARPNGRRRSAIVGGRRLVEAHHATVRGQLARYRGHEIDTAGDGFFATFDGPARGDAMRDGDRCGRPRLGIEVRAGLHTGEVEPIDGKVGGIAVNIGARVAALAGAVGGPRLADREGPGGRLRHRVRGRRRARAEGRPRPLAPVPGGALGRIRRP